MCAKESDIFTLLLLTVTLFGLVVVVFTSDSISSSATPEPASALLQQEQVFGAEANPTGSPIGGGSGYQNIITPTDPRITFTVTTTSELFAALPYANTGDVVYIEEIARIDLTNMSGVTVPEGVTLASNRGETKTFDSEVYSVTVEVSGGYTVWTHASASDTNDTIWISVDSKEPRRWNVEAAPGGRWINGGYHHLSAGQHTLTVQWHKEGVGVDKVVIVNGTGYIIDAAATETDSSTVSSGGRISLGAECPNLPTALIAGGENVRITGIYLEGPYQTVDNAGRLFYGIYSAHRNLEVDNCELLGWNGAAIDLNQTGNVSKFETGGYIHHNYIHHNQGNSLGYGVMVTHGSVCLVEANYFDYCRHAVAGSGVAGDGYEARYNICGPNWPAPSAHNFDMHGKPDPSGSGTIAGDRIWIHHNTFMATEPESSFPVMIQGVPLDEAYIHNNWFLYTQEPPVWQSNGNGNLYVRDNLIGPGGDYQKEGPILYL